MNVILHEGDKQKTFHQMNSDVFQQKIIIPIKVFHGVKNKWADPTVEDKELIYKFSYHDGELYHYQLEDDH